MESPLDQYCVVLWCWVLPVYTRVFTSTKSQLLWVLHPLQSVQHTFYYSVSSRPGSLHYCLSARIIPWLLHTHSTSGHRHCTSLYTTSQHCLAQHLYQTACLSAHWSRGEAFNRITDRDNCALLARATKGSHHKGCYFWGKFPNYNSPILYALLV